MTIGSRIQAARKHKRMTVKELAKKAGLAESTLYDLERGDSTSTTRLPAIAAALGLNALWLEREQGPKEATAGSGNAIPVFSERSERARRLAEEITKLEALDPRIADAFGEFVDVLVARLTVHSRDAAKSKKSKASTSHSNA